MPEGFAIAHLRTPQLNEPVLEYLDRIDDTLAPFGGRFLVHVAEVEAKEGAWPGTVVVIRFPDMEAARAWYDSPRYRRILPLRTGNIEGEAILVEGVGPGYLAGRTAAKLREAAGRSA
jgi:uncharacterized protein (DUF1330 family)